MKEELNLNMLQYIPERTLTEHSEMPQTLVKLLCAHEKEFLRQTGRKHKSTSRRNEFKLASNFITTTFNSRIQSNIVFKFLMMKKMYE